MQIPPFWDFPWVENKFTWLLLQKTDTEDSIYKCYINLSRLHIINDYVFIC